MTEGEAKQESNENAEKNVAEKVDSKPEIDIQHDDEFEEFQVGFQDSNLISKGYHEWMDWDDDITENFSQILKQQRELYHKGA